MLLNLRTDVEGLTDKPAWSADIECGMGTVLSVSIVSARRCASPVTISPLIRIITLSKPGSRITSNVAALAD